MRQIRHVLVAAVLLVLLTIPVYIVVGRQMYATLIVTGPGDGSVPGQFERAAAILLIGHAVTNVIGLGATAFVARQIRPTLQSALLLWVFAAVITLGISLVVEWAQAAGLESSILDSQHFGGVASLLRFTRTLALIWMPGIAAGTAGFRWLTKGSKRPAPDQDRD